ncbi:MAG: GAF and ANTAR domain-containing protein [Nocardioidaceae bacterium]|nr:GAF and ANTAR domain-containing protein [Nocardioidaceae bacterium]
MPHQGPGDAHGTHDLRARVLASMAAASPQGDGDPDDPVTVLNRVCRALLADLPVCGAAVNLMSDAMGSQAVIASSDPWSARVDELQFVLGEGPCHDSFKTRRPVLASDLDRETRWPAYTTSALEAGVRAVFAFPLQVGAVGLGVLDVYADVPGPMPDRDLLTALGFAEMATETLLDSAAPGRAGGLDPGLTSALGTRARIYQAQGALMVDLGVPLVDALVRMRAYAFAHHRDLDEVAGAVLDGTLDLSDDV